MALDPSSMGEDTFEQVGGQPQLPDIRRHAARIRARALVTVERAGLGHAGGDMSAADILAVLYFGVMRFDPARPTWSDRDRFILSKGHCAAALYSTLAEAGFLPFDELKTFAQPLSSLNGHPNRLKVPGVEASTGPLGHGLPIAVGLSLAARHMRSPSRTFVLTGDGELQEGSNWEAAMAASHFGLDSLTVIVDRNRLQQGDWTEETIRLEPLAERWRAFGWAVTTVDGHDHRALMRVLRAGPQEAGKPSCVIANTHKGKGVAFMEDRVEWHHKVPSADQVATALAALGGAPE